MASEDRIMQQLMETFKAEAEEHIQRITQLILSLERGEADQEVLEELFREAHSLKGAARVVELNRISEVAHKIETIFSKLKAEEVDFSQDLADLIYKGLDGISSMVHGDDFDVDGFEKEVELFLKEGKVQGEKAQRQIRHPSTQPEPPFCPNERMMRIDTAKLDRLMEKAGEIVVTKMTARAYLETASEIMNSLERFRRELSARGADKEAQRLKNILGRYKEFLSNIRAICERISSLSDELNEDIKSLRLQPLSFLFNSFDRMVRDISKVEGKKVRLEKQGGNTEIDRRILEELREPLMHILRNAIDHGIESPQERMGIGKPKIGTIRLSARGHGDRVIIEVEDDGRGINTEEIKRAAVKSEVIGKEEADQMAEEEILNLIFNQGVSTSGKVTEISGRGVGLNAVKRKIESLKGTISVESKPGGGCKFMLSLPLTLMTTKVLVVEVNGERYAIPTSHIERTLRIKLDDVMEIGGKPSIRYDRRMIGLIPLAKLLEMEGNPPRDELKVLILSFRGRFIGVTVDDLVVEQEILLQGFTRPLVRVRNVSGATISSGGEVIIVLNPVDLVRTAYKIGGFTIGAPPEKPEPKTVLVVDDSITTRTLEKNIIESAGYNVIVARDGVEAREILRSVRCDLVVSDIQMPNMDGFQLTSWIKNHPDLKDIPVILVTSMESEEDRRKGLEAGADAYVVKSGFDQEELLNMIGRLA
jgi:two-component system chemotaxis sensor kinase CheA